MQRYKFNENSNTVVRRQFRDGKYSPNYLVIKMKMNYTFPKVRRICDFQRLTELSRSV